MFAATLFSSLRRNRAKKSPRGLLVRGRPLALEPLEDRTLLSVVQLNPVSHLSGYAGPQVQQSVTVSPRGPTLPSSYDLRTLNDVTSVKDQGSYGTCWTFATYGSLESSILMAGGPTTDFSEANLANTAGFDWGPNDGGNSYMSEAYLSRYSGPINESADPYSNVDQPDSVSGPVQDYVREMLRFDTTVNSIDQIKTAIMTDGALYTTMYMDPAYYDSASSTYYYNGKAATNHAVTVVGWDDNKVTAGGTGAWLIKNSWGTSWGDGGYFWLSYQDAAACKTFESFGSAASASSVSEDYNWASFGDVGEISASYAMSAFTADANSLLKSAGFFTEADNAAYTVSVYSTFSGGQLSGLLATTSGTEAYAGWHTVDLPSSLSLAPATKFYLSVSLTNGGSYPTAISYAAPGYDSSCTASPGHSYYSSDGTTWTDLTTLQPTDSACIAALTVVTTPPTVTSPNITLSGASGTGGTFRTGDTVTATWNNSASGDNDPGITAATMDFSQFGGGSSVAAVDHGDFWTATYKITQGSIDGANASVLVTATNAAGATTTAGPSALVDNQPPVVSDAFITIISTGSGPNGSYRAGDRLTIEWDNSASGDHNTDLASSNPVTVDFSQFGGSSTVAASDASDFWTASSTITAFSPTSQSVVVTATDQAGNVTKTSYTTSLTVTPVATTTAISLSSQAITYGQSDTFTANVQAAGLSSSSLVGSVQFYVDGAAVGPAVGLMNGRAQWIDPKLSGGSHSVYAVYTSGSPALFGNSQSSVASVAVAKANLTVAADAKTMVYGAPVPALSYTVTGGWVGGDSSGSYPLVNPPALFTAGKSTSPVGQYTIFVYGGFDPNYTFTYVTGKLTISPAVLTITAQSSTMVYGSGALPNLGVSYSGLANGDLSWQVLTTSPVVTTVAKAGSHAGIYAITVSGATLQPNANYTLNYVSGTLAITPAPLLISASQATMVYGGTPPILQWSVTGLVNGDTRAIIITPPTLSGVSSGLHVGNYAITPSGAVITPVSAGDYTIAYATAALTVTPANLILKADDETVVYGTTPVPPSFHVIGLVGGATLASIEDPTPYFYGPDLQYADGTYPQPGTPVNESQLKTQPATADLPYPAPSVTLEVPDFSNVGVYRDAIDFRNTSSGATNHYGGPGDYLNDGSVGDIIYNPDEWYRSYNYWAASGSGSPQWTVVNPATGLPDPHAGGMLREAKNVNGLLDYNITYQPGTLTIVPATLNVVVDSQDMTYGGPLPYFSYSYSGLVNSDTLTSITGGPSLDSFAQYTMATSLSNAGVYQIGQPFTSANPNYVVNFVPGTLTIDPATLYITANTANDQWLTYGQIAIAPQPDGSVLYEMPDQSQYTVSGLVNGDLATPNLVATDYHAGQAAIYVAGVQITGNGTAADYVINTTPGIATILPATLTITTLDQTLTYGDIVVVNPTTFALPNDTASGLASQISVTGWQYSDNLSSLSALPTLTTDSYHANADALGNPTGPAYTIYADGAGLSDDYTVQYVNSGQLTILPRELTISPVEVNDGSATIETTYGVDPNSQITYAGGEEWHTTPAATLSGLSAPSALAFDGKGNLYVVNSGANTVSEFAPDGTLVNTLTGLNGPLSLAVDDSGDVVVGNSDGTVSVFYAGSTTPVTQSLPSGGVPAALLFDPASGNLYVADSQNGCVYEADSISTPPSVLTGANGSPLSSPSALAFDPVTGQLYVANAGDGTVSVFDPGSSTPDETLTLPAGSMPDALAVDDAGQLYVADQINGCVYEFARGSTTPDLNLTRTGFDDPTALAVDSLGNLYVTSYGSGSGTTVSAFAPGSTTASATYTTGLNGPAALTLDSNGALYVANQSDTTVSVFAQPTSQLQYGDSLESLGIVPDLTWSDSSGSQPTDAGSYPISAMAGVPDPQPFVTDYTIDYGTANLVINKAPLTLTTYLTLDGVNPASDVTYNGTDYNQQYDPSTGTGYLTYLASGLQYSDQLSGLADSNGGFDDLSGLTVSTDPMPAVHAGSYAVNFDYPPDQDPTISLENYTLTCLSGSFTIDPATLTITAADQYQDANGNPLVYGGTQPDLTASAQTVSVIGLAPTDTFDYGQLTLSTDDTINPYNDLYHAGQYTLTVNGPDFGPDYTTVYQPGVLMIQQAQLTITATQATPLQYGQLDPGHLASEVTYTPSGLAPNDSLDNLYVGGLSTGISGDLTVSTDATTSLTTGYYNAGSADLFADGPSQTDDYAISYDVGALQIDQATLSIQAIDQTGLTYGGTQPNFTPSSNPPATSPTVQATGLVAALPGSGLPGDTLANLGVTSELRLWTDDTLSGAGYYHAGSHYNIFVAPQPLFDPITLANYTIDPSTGYVPGKLQISPASSSAGLTITAASQTGLTYGGAQPNLIPSASTVTVTGLLPGDTIDYSKLVLSTSDTINPNSGMYHAGTYAITVAQGTSGSPESDYATINYATGSLQINQAALTITAGNLDKTYGVLTPSNLASYVTCSSTGLVTGDTLANIGLLSGLTASTNASVSPGSGCYDASGPSGWQLNIAGPSSTQDYSLSYGSPAVLTIDRAALQVTPNNLEEAYGVLTPSNLASYVTYTTAGLISGDTLANIGLLAHLNPATDATTSPGSGYYDASGPSGWQLNVTGPNNTLDYNPITYGTATLTIDPAGTLTFIAQPASMTYGATSLPALTYSVSGLLPGDTLSSAVVTPPTLSTNATAALPGQPGHGSHVSGSPYTIYIGGAVLRTNSQGVSDYKATYVPGNLTVNRAPLTIIADNKWMLQGASPASLPLTVSYATLVNGDTAANLTTQPTVTTTATSASPLGSYPITVGGAADPDYTISYVSGVLTVATTNNSVYLIPDPLNPGQSILYIWGTNGNDTIMVAPGTNPNSVSVIMNGVFRGAFGSASQPISRIVAHGIAGRDSIAVSQNVTIPAWLYGDNGTADNLSGGGGPTYLFGGVGANTLVGGKGRSILIGGAGSGSLAGGSGDAILIGGTTAYNPASPTDTTKDAALLAILNEWSNTAEDYGTRAGRLLGTLPGGLNGPYDLIAGSTVFGNSAIDKLVGSSTATDLFFISAHDTLNGQHTGELPPISV